MDGTFLSMLVLSITSTAAVIIIVLATTKMRPPTDEE